MRYLSKIPHYFIAHFYTFCYTFHNMAPEYDHNTALIVGGTSGLGLEIATLLHTQNNFEVYVTGRKKPEDQRLRFVRFNINPSVDHLLQSIDDIIPNLPQQINLLVYAAGFYQEGTIKQLTDEDIRRMLNVGLVTPTLFVNRLLNRQARLPGFIAITSTSQWTPRIYEPVYTAVKASLGMFANSLSLDPQVEKVLVAGPAGMKTNFWSNTDRDTSTMLDPVWVAEQVCQLYFANNFKYKCARILRDPPRIEVMEER